MKVSAESRMSKEPVPIPKIFRSLAVVGMPLLVPIMSFVAFGSWMEPAAAALLRRETNSIRIATIVRALAG